MPNSKPGWLILWWAIALAWFSGWLLPATRALWDRLDELLFFQLNGLLADSVLSQNIWAVANWRPFDMIAAAFIFAIGLGWTYRLQRNERLSALSGLAVLLVIILATRFSAAFLLYITDYQRYSPSITLTPVYRLSELVTWIEAKDYHKDCFPGDHGYVVMACITFFFVRAGRAWGVLALVLLSPFMLPRLVSGAHWATDIIIGSGTMALVSLPLLFATPLYEYAVRISNRLLGMRAFRPVLNMLRLQ